MAEAIRVLGAPQVRAVGAWRPLPLDLRSALLGVLARDGGRVPREAVASVFWPDGDERLARQNLRQLLRRARALVPTGAVEADATSLRLTCATDLDALRPALAGGGLADALGAVHALARAPLLLGLEALPNPEWQAWLDLERRAIEEQVRRALLGAARSWAVQGVPPPALAALAAWCDRDAFDEEMLIAYLECARTAPEEVLPAGERLQRARALLRSELGLPASPRLEAAAERLRDGPRAPPAGAPPDGGAPVRDDGAPGEPRGGARRPTVQPGGELPFVGRIEELSELDEAVADAQVRVVTVHGVGGIGKSRLAREWAAERGTLSLGQVPFVAMAGAAGPPEAQRRIAAALGWNLDDATDAAALGARLGRHCQALVLDEVEGLTWLPAWLGAVLDGGDSLTVVVTSRERLGVPGEHVVRLRGLATTATDAAVPPSALRLFLHAAHRLRRDVHFEESDRAAITAFAERVGGSPLALIVAAGWLQLGPPEHVLATLIDGDDDVLAIGNVLAPSWARLEPRARQALEALAVFPGRFPVAVALEVAATDRRTLRTLVDAALVEPGNERGLALHPLVRAEAARRLAARPEAKERALAAHARSLAARLGDRGRSLYGGRDQLATLSEVVDGLDDLRQAWGWACARGEVDVLDALLDLVWAMELRGWYRLGEELMAAAVGALEAVDARAGGSDSRAKVALARALARQGIFAMRRGDARRTRSTAERARALFDATGAEVDAFVLFHLGIASMLEGDLDGAERWHRVLVDVARSRGDTWSEAGALANLGVIARDRGDLAAALAAFEELERGGTWRFDAWGEQLLALNLARTLLDVGGRDHDALRHARRAVDRARLLGSRAVELIASVVEGVACERSGRAEEAATAFARAQRLDAEDALAEVSSDRYHASFVVEELARRHTARPGVTPRVTPPSRPTP